jgi:polar amino acid transport system substrate-binding protein
MHKNIILLIVFIISNLSAYDIMTENYPPFNYANKDGKIEGLTTEIVNEIMKNTENEYPIKIMPWARAYQQIINKPNKILFSMTRTPEREYLFKWVGPIASNSFVFYAKSDSNIQLNSLEDAKNDNYKIGTYLNGANELYLKSKNFYNIYSVPDDLLNVKKLIKGRIDLWAAGETQGLYKAKQLNINPKKIKKVFKIKETQLYIAFSRTTPTSIIKQWQHELNKMKKDGRYKKIVDKYLK